MYLISTTSTYLTKFLPMLTLIVITGLMTACDQQIDPIKESTVTNIASAARTADTNATLKSTATFPIGATPGSWISKKTKGYQMFESNFNSKTVHAYMSIESAENKFNFQEIDYWVKWAETNPIRLHGHCLVFHTGAPDWMLQYKGTTAQFEQMIKNHIQTIVSRHKGKIKSWDVFNEVFTSKGGIDQTAFRKMYSSDEDYMKFIKRCFLWAHEADPKAQLFYNDYSLENSQAKLDAVIKMVEDFKRSGVQIDGLGSQMHINLNTSDAGIRNSFLKLAATGLLIHVSELDVALNPNNDANLEINQQLLNAQRSKYQTVASLYKQIIPSRLQHGITVWDFSDADSWIVAQKKKKDAPCIFDANYNKKPAFYGILDGLKN